MASPPSDSEMASPPQALTAFSDSATVTSSAAEGDATTPSDVASDVTVTSAAVSTGGDGGVPFVHLDAAAVLRLLPLSTLIPHLRDTLPLLSPTITAPPRHHHRLSPSPLLLLLLMPAWSLHPSLPYLGVKLLTSSPSALHATYTLFSSLHGRPLASLHATPLTLLRTAAVSALASHHLSLPTAATLLMVGAGALAPHLIAAHLLVRPSITHILIWNRSPQRARDMAARLSQPGLVVNHVECLDDAVSVADIISCATGSETPLVKGGRLKEGAHLDLVGSFTPGMRECDDEAMGRGRVFVDFEEAVGEAGEIVGAMERGVMRREDVAGTLVELLGGVKVGRRSEEEVTVFKSVGTAVVDILAAQLAYESYLRGTR